MKTRKIQPVAFAAMCAVAISTSAQELGAGSIFARVDDQAKKVTAAYAAIHEGFYAVGQERTLLRAALDVRPDGTPNITLDRAAGMAQFTIRLSVDDSAYNAWKAEAHRRIEDVGMSVQFSDFEDPEARVIGGKPYRFGANEEAAIRRWEKSDAPKRAELTVRVDFVKADGAVAKRYELPIKAFKRLGFDSYPLPLHHLNRLQDLSGSRFPWGKTEDSYATFTLTDLTDDFLSSVADVRCTVIDDAILIPEREEAARIARERAEREAREREEAARIAREKVEREAREREEAARIAREKAEREARERAESARMVREKAEREARERAEKVASSIISGMVQIPGKNFKMGKYEVTQAQWEAVMGNNPSHFKGADNPVENVSWDDCQEFLKKINALPPVKKSGLVFRLPTEKEWEYACRAGSTGDYCKLADGTEITESTLGEVAWYYDNSGRKTHPVGQKKPNAFGLYDMHGNVWEWCEDLYEAGNSYRVDRGGSWSSCSGYCSAGDRGNDDPGYRDDLLGFRLAAFQDVNR